MRIHYDPVNGDDANPGTWLAPFRTWRRVNEWLNSHGPIHEDVYCIMLEDTSPNRSTPFDQVLAPSTNPLVGTGRDWRPRVQGEVVVVPSTLRRY